MEMKSLLSEMKSEITKMNAEIYQIKEQLKKTKSVQEELKTTFSYSSAYWSNMKSYSPGDGKTGLDDRETKLANYWSTPFKQLCVGMKVNNSVQFIPISYFANSLYDILAGGKFHSTVILRNTWKSLNVGSSLQPNCGRQGFNVVAEHNQHARVRIGIIGNNENSCNSADSFLGFGAIDANQRGYCNSRNIVNSCGNSAYCGGDNGDKEVRAMAVTYLLVNTIYTQICV
ncbi:Hypothetical predicted protein [Paramuricea clavata]|uniref:Uncharacterized protein n=1 Tax=Paramuricea clavata TaxID=317549 RepID=A0A7D9I685_PARCT|nr:Hypothetical predicted protein [Paramuricea clavata]